MNLSQIRIALDNAGVRPAKRLGQNFLHDQNLARWIVEQAQISEDDFVLEIGPGLGALTSEILKRGARLLALEKDARLANFLREKFRDPRFELHHGDALDFDTWMKMDMQYIDTWSLALDWKIIFRTIPRVLTGKGAH